ncbi:hypothetical protein KXV92_002909 [Aspergillus fumigatus]|nr:hypothetical protein KXV92_002909 [Aspergillus fumigatus]
MNLESDQKKVDKLARIRENQRRSRARKQEHIRDLEQKLACLQEQVHKKDVEHRLVAQRLEMENRKLRYLLSYSGIPPQTVEEYLRTSDDPAVTQKVAIPALRRSEFQSENLRQEMKCSRPCGGKSSNTVSDFQNGDDGHEIRNGEKPRSTFDPVMTANVVLPPLQRPEIQPEAPCQETKPFSHCSSSSDRSERDASTAAVQNQLLAKVEPSDTPEPSGKTTSREARDPSERPRLPPLCDCAPSDNQTDRFPSNGDVLNTTLCAIADELIQQYNTRGMDITEIRKKLWAGFSKGLTTEEGCRVQNQILFQVLDEISNH